MHLLLFTTILPLSLAQSFGYHGLTGPTNWYALDPAANALCATGRNQSPINIPTASMSCDTANAPVLSIPAQPQGADFVNLGTTVEVELHNGTLTDATGKVYHLAQFHFHTPSEHAIDDEYSVLEVHFVFQAEDGTRSVVGFMIELGEGDALLESVLGTVSDIPNNGDRTVTGPLDFSALATQLSEGGAYRYSGSLTTPPCHEGIAWNVACRPLTVSVETFQRVKDVVKFNARFTQGTPGEINVLENVANALCGSA